MPISRSLPTPVVVAIAVAGFTLCTAACSSEPELTATVDEVETILNTAIESLFESDFQFHVQECMIANGFDEFRLPSSPSSEAFGAEVMSRIEEAGGERRYLALYGSGLVDVLYQDGEPHPNVIEAEPTPRSEREVTDLEYEYLYSRSAALPRTDFGDDLTCYEYGLAALKGDYPQFADMERLNSGYGKHMAENFFASPEYAALEDERIDCIREAGFDEVSADKSADDIIMEWNNRLAEQGLASDSPEVQELADYDRRLAVTGFDCHGVIYSRWKDHRDRIAQDYLDSNAAALNEMTKYGG